jgi:ribose transport system permease protein
VASVNTVQEPSPVSPTESAAAARRRRGALLLNAERFGLLAVFVVMTLVFSLLAPSTFPTAANWRSIAISQSVEAVAAVAMLIPLVGGRFDISVGPNIGLCAVATASVMAKAALPLSVAVVVGIGIGTFVGIVNGVIVAYLGVNSFVGTLGTGTVIGGLVQWYTGGTPIVTNISGNLTNLSVDSVIGLPALFVVTLGIAFCVWFLQMQTTYGRKLTALGYNLQAARLAGFDLRRIVLLSFVLCGAIAGMAGVLQVASEGSGDPSVGSITLILPAFAALFLGSTAFTPGKFNVPGTLLGLFFVGSTVSGLALLGAQDWVEPVFDGVIVVTAVALSQAFRARRTGEWDIGT